MALVPFSNEILVNNANTTTQQTPAIAIDSDGDYVVIWESVAQDDPTQTNRTGLFGQRFTFSGTKVGSEFQVNTVTNDNQGQPAVVYDPLSGFTVVWDSFGQDGSNYGVYSKRYNSAGVPQTGDSLVNTTTTGAQRDPVIARDATGNYVVVWRGNGSGGDSNGIYFQRFNAAGTALGGETLVNTASTDLETQPAVAMNGSGAFVVAYTSTNGTDSEVFVRLYNSSGIAVINPIQVNVTTTSAQNSPVVAIDNNGNFVVVWESSQNSAATAIDLYGRRFSSTGAALSGEFLISTVTAGNQSNAAIALDGNGNFTVAWQSVDQDGSGSGIYARQFSSAGVALGAEFLVNQTTAGDQVEPAIAMQTKGDFAIAWRNQSSGNGDIYVRSYSANNAPTGLTLSTTSINENVAANSVVANLSTIDPDIGDTFTYTLVTGTGSTDNSVFSIVDNQLRINSSPNFEAKNSYSIRVRTTDQRGLSFESPFTININNVNETPTAIALSAASINENVAANSVVGNFSTTDPDTGNTFTYSLVAGTGSTDNAAFSIVGNQLRINNSPDFETKSSYSIRVRTTDQGGLTFESPFTITVNDLAENTAPRALILSATNIDENVAANSVVANLSTIDPDIGDTFTYSLVSGTGSTDNAAFSIVGNQLRINSSPNFEAKNSYSIRVRTTDQGGLSFESPFTITINNVNEIPTAIALSASSINENVAANSVVGNFSTIDPDTGNTFTYSLVAGTGSTDNAAFSIVGNQLRINNSPDFETKSSYSIRVRTTDQGGLTFESPFTITVNDLAEQNIINGTANSDILKGTAQDDIITGFKKADLIITGAGRDSIVYTSLNDGIDLISDFSVGNDKIVLTSLLDSIISGGYNGTNAIADGYVQVRSLLGNINLIFSVDIDADGIGNSKSFQSLTTVTGFDLTLSRLNNPSNFVF
jgi:hypothetical protein